MKETYIVLWDDNTTDKVQAYNISEAYEEALELEHNGKILDVFIL